MDRFDLSNFTPDSRDPFAFDVKNTQENEINYCSSIREIRLFSHTTDVEYFPQSIRYL